MKIRKDWGWVSREYIFSSISRPLLPQKHPINSLPRTLLPRICDPAQKLLQLFPSALLALDPAKHPPHITAHIAIMEQADILARSQRRQKFVQSAGPFGEGKHIEALVGNGGAAAIEVADVGFSKLVGGEIGSGHAGGVEGVQETAVQGSGGDGDTHKDSSGRARAVAVAEFRDGVREHGFDEFGEGAWLFGDADGEEGFLLLAEGGALGDEAEPVEVHVGARGDGNELAFWVGGGVGRNVFFEAGEGEGAGGLDDGAGVFEDVLDGGAGLVGGDFDNGIDNGATEAECFFADGFDGGAVGEKADFGEDDTFVLFEGLDHCVCVVGFYANYFDVRCDTFKVDPYTSDKSAAADAAEDGFEVGHACLAQKFHADGTLAGNDVRIVEGGDIDEAMEGLKALGFSFRSVEVVAVQDNGATETGDIQVFDGGCAGGHDYCGGDLEMPC